MPGKDERGVRLQMLTFSCQFVELNERTEIKEARGGEGFQENEANRDALSNFELVSH